MKLEILFKNNSFKEQLSNITIPDNVSKRVYCYAGLHSVTYEINDKSLISAKTLSDIRKSFVDNKIDCYISIDEAIEFFNVSLYPKFNMFERNLRRLIYIIAIKSGDREMLEYANIITIHRSFGKLMEKLFKNEEKLKPIKKRSYNSEFMKQMTERQIDGLSKKTLWSYFVAQNSFTAAHSKELGDCRNDVMHSNEMSFETFVHMDHVIEESNREVELLIAQYLNRTYISTPAQEALKKIAKNFINLAESD